MRRLVPALLAASVVLLPSPLLAGTAAATGVVLHALMPIGVVTIIYAVVLRDLP